MDLLSIYAAWSCILLGFLAGAAEGLYFHRAEWLGGYDSWPRRMMRLGHISLFGLPLISLAAVFTARYLAIASAPMALPLALLLVAQFTMPLICYLAAFRKPLRHLFPIPVLSLMSATVLFLVAGIRS